MKKYKVIALSVGADSNRIFSAGEEVFADAWADPNMAEELVKQGFLEPLAEAKKAKGSEEKGESLNDLAEKMRGQPKEK